MDEILELVRNTDSFKKYAELVEKHKSNFSKNSYLISKSYSKEDPTFAIMENAKIEQTEEGININIWNTIGEHKVSSNPVELFGEATYDATISKENEDLILNGSIDAKYTLLDNTMYYMNEEGGIKKEVNETILNEKFENKFEEKAYLYPSKTR